MSDHPVEIEEEDPNVKAGFEKKAWDNDLYEERKKNDEKARASRTSLDSRRGNL